MADTFFDPEEKSQSQGFTLDFKRVLSRAIRFWYLILLSLGLAFSIAFYQNRYTQKTFPVSASIVIREVQEIGGAEFIYKNALVDQYRNYLNEPYIIRSYPLVEQVVQNLNLNVSFYREGYFMTTEAYDYVPVKAAWCYPKKFKSGQFLFTLKDETHYSLSKFSTETDATDDSVFLLGDSIDYNGYSLCINRIPDRPLKQYLGVPFLLSIANPTSIAGAYIGRLRVDWAAEGAGIINLAITGTNPQKEIDFLNELIQEYSHRDLNRKNETAEQTIAFIRKQLIAIKDSLRVVEFQLERFGNSSRVKDMSVEAQRMFVKLEAFELQKAELLIRQNYYLYVTEYLSKSEGNLDQVILPSSMGISDQVLSALISKMVDLQLEIKSFISPEQGRNPMITAKVERINEIKKNVEEAVMTLRSTDKIKMDFLNKQLKDTERQLGMLPASERQLISVQRNYSLLENLYVFLMQKLSEAGISKASNTSDIIAVNPPMRGGAMSPQPMQNYTMALILGLAFPFIIFILFEIINNKV
ncbi:MAG: hypothetical protein ABL895_15980, partial [Cyclobacteriaceae bacterium]